MNREEARRLEIEEYSKIAIEIEALICERAGMIAENQIREHRGESLAYNDRDFRNVAASMRALKPHPVDPPDVDAFKAAVEDWNEETDEYAIDAREFADGCMDEIIFKASEIVPVIKKGRALRDAAEKRIKEQAERIRDLEARFDILEPEGLVEAKEKWQSRLTDVITTACATGEKEKELWRLEALAARNVINLLEKCVESLKGRKP